MSVRTINVGEVLDNSRFTAYQYVVCTLCFLVVFLDGFDLTVIGVCLPKIADFLHAKPAALGLALSAGQFGPLIGALILGTLADRYGRKWMLVISALIFGIFTVATAFITSTGQLALFRFLSGIGLGGAIPNALTFGSEYAPARVRKGMVATMYAGMPSGAMIGGLSAAWLIPHSGWQSLFFLGGGIPLVIAVVIALAMPESLEFLMRRGKSVVRIRKILSRIDPVIASDKDVEFKAPDKKLAGVPVKHLFMDGRAFTTIFLWLICSGALYMLWILNTWSPSLLRKGGATVVQYSLAYAALNLGALVSSIIVGRLLDKWNPWRVLQMGFVLAFIVLVTFGFVAGSGSLLAIAAMSVVCGLFINGSQTGTLAVATVSYPPDIRASGIGWTYAIAKIGAMGAPAVGGVLLGLNWTIQSICGVQAVLGIIVALLLLVLERHITGKTKGGYRALLNERPAA